MNIYHRTHLRSFAIVFLIITALVLLTGAPAHAAPPDNDDFDNATVITSLPFTVTQSTVEATTAPDDPDCYSAYQSVWFAFTPEEDTWLRAHTNGSDYDTTLGVFTGARGSLTELACDDDGGEGVASQVVVEATAGETYYFMAGAYGRFGGNLRFTVEEVLVAPNDDFDDALAITGLPYKALVLLDLATTAIDDPDCYGSAHTVWFAFKPAKDVNVAANTFGSDFDTTLGVYTGERGALNEIGCNDEILDSTESYVAFEASAGETYYIMAGHQPHYEPGVLQFNLQELGEPGANDDFDDAAVISELPYISSVYSSGLTVGDDDPEYCRFQDYPTAWFAYTPGRDMALDVRADGSNFPWFEGGARAPNAVTSFPGVIGVYTGERGALKVVTCGIEQLRLDVRGGETYFFMVSGMIDGPYAKVLFSLREAPPVAPNDDLDDATVIDGLPFVDRVFTGDATTGDDEPSIPGCAASVWYTFTPERWTWVSFDTAGSNFDTILALYSGERGHLTRLALNDDDGETLQSRLRYYAQAGETYYLMVCSYTTDIPTNLQLNVTPTYYYYIPFINGPVGY